MRLSFEKNSIRPIACAVLLLGGVSLPGCSSTPEPAVIFDLQQDKTVIQARAGTLFEGDSTATTEADIMATARKACGLHNRRPLPVSEGRVGDYRRLLFACVK